MITKYLRRQLDRQQYPAILLLVGKHEDDYYLVMDEGDLGRAALEILAARLDPKYGYIRKPDDEPYGIRREVTPEVLAELPDGLANAARQAARRNQELRAEHADQVRQYAEAKAAIENSDGLAAYQVLRDRSDHPYEMVQLIAPRRPR